MRWTRMVLGGAIGLALTAQVASAQSVAYNTTGTFSGFCAGLTCTNGGMTITYNPLAAGVIVLDSNNGFYSQLSYGSFTVSGAAATQQFFPGTNFTLTITQTTPTGGSQMITGAITGGADATSSGLRWTPLPTSFSILPIGYTVFTVQNSFVALQAPSSNNGLTTIQGDMTNRNSIVPEPSTYLLMSAGLAGVLVFARKRRVS